MYDILKDGCSRTPSTIYKKTVYKTKLDPHAHAAGIYGGGLPLGSHEESRCRRPRYVAANLTFSPLFHVRLYLRHSLAWRCFLTLSIDYQKFNISKIYYNSGN